MGVRKALEKVLTEVNKGESALCTFGPLIHNRQVMELLESKGVKSVDDITDLEDVTLLIRAHGIPPHQRKELKSSGLRIIDATCPRVAKVQAIIRYHTNKGYTPVIVGDKDHAEVIGLVGYGNGRAHVINTISEVQNLPESDKLLVVAQTTRSRNDFKKITKAIKERYPTALIFDTICHAARDRQEEVRAMAEQVDGIVVVGGYHSGNTLRLVKASEEAGLPTFHVETEKELDREKLSSMEVIGVTAGASTPNWMIKKVINEIEVIRSRRETFIGRWIKRVFKFLHLSNILAALGAFSLSYADTILSGRRPGLIHPVLAFLYIYAMRVLNRFLDKGASTYNDPERAHFYRKYRVFLILTGIASFIGALVLAFNLGVVSYLVMAGLSILGIIYSIPIVPSRIRHLWRYSKMKDIPGSKTLLEALAWAVVITWIPLLESEKQGWTTALILFYIVLALAYVRAAFFEILQVQGDMIVGVETLPITLGEKRTIWLLKGVIISAALLLLAASVLGLVRPFAFFLLLSFLSLSICLSAYEKESIYPGPRLEYMIEGSLIMVGLMGLIGQILS